MLQRILPLLFVVVLPMRAVVHREIRIQAPAKSTAGSTVSINFHASTDASDGEQIASFDAEYSVDAGLTWAQLYHTGKSGSELKRKASFTVNVCGGMAIVRARAVFGGGVAGDVDYKGGAIQWNGSWQKWRWPPAKYAVIDVPKVKPPKPVIVHRVINIQAPAEAAPGSNVSVTVNASTDASDGEQIGFLHAEYSIDEGKTWNRFCYAENAGAGLSRQAIFAVNPKGGKAIVRARVAYRGGAAGDVDYQGSAIQWNDSWREWHSPATKYAIIYVPKSLVASPQHRVTVHRTVSIQAPAEAIAGSTVSVTVKASTDANDGEQIGMLHADYSTDEGKTWTSFFYVDKAGAKLSHKVSFATNEKGEKALVRVRVAFRGGVAGDVDYEGGAIQWNGSWQKWHSPAAKYAIIYVSKP